MFGYMQRRWNNFQQQWDTFWETFYWWMQDTRLAILMDRLPRLPNQVSWQHYLNQLDDVDRHNVLELCRRLQSLSTQRNLPLAVMVFGDFPGKANTPINLRLFGLHSEDWDINLLLAGFIRTQPEIHRDENSKPIMTDWQAYSSMRASSYWQLDFVDNRSLRCFVGWHIGYSNLETWLQMMADNPVHHSAPFTYSIIIPQPKNIRRRGCFFKSSGSCE